MRRTLAVVAVFLTVVAMFGQSNMVFAECPIPPDLSIVPPDNSLPENIKALTKSWWETTWQFIPPNTMDALLIFEKVSANRANVIYSRGALQRPLTAAGYGRAVVELKPVGDDITFRMDGPRSTLEFTFKPSKNVIECFDQGKFAGRAFNTTFKPRQPKN